MSKIIGGFGFLLLILTFTLMFFFDDSTPTAAKFALPIFSILLMGIAWGMKVMKREKSL